MEWNKPLGFNPKSVWWNGNRQSLPYVRLAAQPRPQWWWLVTLRSSTYGDLLCKWEWQSSPRGKRSRFDCEYHIPWAGITLAKKTFWTNAGLLQSNRQKFDQRKSGRDQLIVTTSTRGEFDQSLNHHSTSAPPWRLLEEHQLSPSPSSASYP